MRWIDLTKATEEMYKTIEGVDTYIWFTTCEHNRYRTGCYKSIHQIGFDFVVIGIVMTFGKPIEMVKLEEIQTKGTYEISNGNEIWASGPINHVLPLMKIPKDMLFTEASEIGMKIRLPFDMDGCTFALAGSRLRRKITQEKETQGE